MKFKEKTEYVFKSINNSFNIERMLLNDVEVNEFKQAIERGLDDYDRALKFEPIKEITLTEEQFNIVKTSLSNTYLWFREGCDCGDFIIYLEGIGYFTLSTHCRKSSSCDDEMLWSIDDYACIYDKSVYNEMYDWENIELLYKVNGKQVQVLKDVANESIRQLKNMDEYGEELYKEGK